MVGVLHIWFGSLLENEEARSLHICFGSLFKQMVRLRSFSHKYGVRTLGYPGLTEGVWPRSGKLLSVADSGYPVFASSGTDLRVASGLTRGRIDSSIRG